MCAFSINPSPAGFEKCQFLSRVQLIGWVLFDFMTYLTL